jgi:hypothetical protein
MNLQKGSCFIHLPHFLLWIGDKLLPEAPDGTYSCGDMGSASIPLKISSQGVVTLDSGIGHGIASWKADDIGCTYQACWQTWQDTVTISRR